MLEIIFQLSRIALRLWLRQRFNSSVSHLKIRGIRAYIIGVQTARQIAILVLILFLGAVLFLGMLILIITGLMMILPWSYETKAFVLLGIGSLGLGVAISIVLYGLSENRWLKLFQVNQLLGKLSEDSNIR